MNRTQTVELITYLNRAGLVGAMEGQAAVWADALSDIRAEDAQTAAREFARTRKSTERWVTPGDIRGAVEEIRRERVLGAPSVHAPNAATSIEWRKAWTRLLGDGLPPAEAYQRACQHTGDAPIEDDVRFLAGRPATRLAISHSPDAWMQDT